MEHTFVHLHTHSHYSLLDGLSKISDLVKTAKAYGMPALALTDHGAMYGAIHFYKECKKQGIKPIIGVEAYIAERSRHDKEHGIDSKRYHLTLLAKNEAGYKNLIRMVTKANLEGYYYKPRMDHDLLREHAEGVICLSGCPGSRFINHLKNGNEEEAKKLITFYIEIFGKENVFIEIMKHDEIDWYKALESKIVEVAKDMDLPIVGTYDSHYLHSEDQEAHETLLKINTGIDARGQGGMSMKEGNYSFIDGKTAQEIFKNIPGATENTLKVAEMCELELDLGHFIFPDFALPPNVTADDQLLKLAEAGLVRRNLVGDKDTLDRLEYELGIIKMKGYAAYFLVVEDLIRFANENNILSNIRGSVAGSMTTYLLGITKVNPLEYKIPFERFLNPERPSAPDIDMDFSDNRRDEVIEYAKQKYGADKVAQIGTFGTMMARGAVRDVARALSFPYLVGDRLSKMIPLGSQGFPMTIDHALEMVPELKEAYDNERDAKMILDLAKKLEGSPRHISVHAAGVVIAPKPLTEYVPTQFDPKGGKIITQYDMYTVEDVGLTKFDFLGIRNLSILGDAVSLVKKTRNIDVDLENLPLDDKKTFALLTRGDTEGLFQLNGSGMTRFLKELKPSSIHDINAMVALYRPGPMQFIPEYIKRKHNPKLVKYLDPALEEILAPTYGILVYQDDLLIMAHNLAGYTWGEVDKFRKAVGKKIPEEMALQKDKFIKGCIKYSNWSEKKATEIWKWIEPFAAYGFNKAHAASYGRVSFQTAYMKAHFPVEYMTAILTAESGDVDKISEIVHECKNMNIQILPPDVNESFGGFTVIDSGKDDKDAGAIRFGMYTIKNLGTDIANAVIAERKSSGEYTSITNFLERIKHKNLNKKSLDAMIKSGALDNFGERGQLIANMETLLAFNKDASRDHGDQQNLFGAGVSFASLNLTPSNEATAKEKLAWEKELLGLYVSGHPLSPWQEKIDKLGTTIKGLLETAKSGKPIMLAGIVEDVRMVMTKKNQRMAFVRISDMTGSIEAVVFPDNFKDLAEILATDQIIVCQGSFSLRNGEKSIIIEKAKVLS